MKKYFSSIKFWIIFFFVIRLYGITNPPIEISHNWRQTQTLMIARNFESNPDIFYPSIDFDGGRTIAMEFPFFNYLIFLFNKVAGYAHWHGRLINLIVTTLGVYFFFRIIKIIKDPDTAFYSSIILGASIFFSFGRKIMPDTFSVSLTITGTFIAYLYIYETRKFCQYAYFFLSMIFIALGVLSKIPAMIILVFLLLPLADGSLSILKKSGIVFIVVFALISSSLWYIKWNSHLLDENAYPIIFPSDVGTGVKETLANLSGVLEKFYFSAFSGFISFFVFCIGIFLVILRNEKNTLIILTVSFIVFLYFILKTSHFFYFHNYYIIPFVPFMALITGYAFSQIKNNFARSALIIVSVSESLLNQQHDFRLREDLIYKTQLESLLNKFTGYDQKIFVNTGPGPQLLYFANRKGWLLDNPSWITKAELDSISSGSYALVVLDKSINTDFSREEFGITFENDKYLFLTRDN